MNMKEDKPLISFIITYYNLPVQMLLECIDSILALSLRPFEREIIIIDDGSDQSPINDLMRYGDDIIYVRQKNGGVSVARNKGMDIATGTYIQFVDGDDQLITAPYEQCLDIVRYQQNVDMVLFDFSPDAHVETIPESVLPVNGSTYMRNNNIHGAAWGYLFRQTIRGELVFTPHIQYGEDEEFTAQLLLRAETIYPLKAKAYLYRNHEASVTHQNGPISKQKRLDDSFNIIKSLNSTTDKLAHTDRLAMQRRIAQLTMDYIYNIIVMTRSPKELDQRVKRLYENGLFPLPDQSYTTKYKWFRRMTNSKLGMKILLYTLPHIKHER